jgi:hypothetical protein
MTDNVITLPGGNGELPDNPLRLAARPAGFCQHDQVMVDEHERTLYCANPKCGAALDPFNFIRGEARTLAMAWERYRFVTAEARDVAERVSVLKKEEARLRAQVKRLQEKSGGLVNTRGQV